MAPLYTGTQPLKLHEVQTSYLSHNDTKPYHDPDTCAGRKTFVKRSQLLLTCCTVLLIITSFPCESIPVGGLSVERLGCKLDRRVSSVTGNRDDDAVATERPQN